MAIPIVLYIITRRPVDSKKIIEKIRGDHEAIARYLNAIEQIEAEYEKSSEELDREKRKHIRQLMKDTSNDPSLIAKEIERLTGIKIYITE